MISDDKITAWSQLYRQRRTEGEPGWAGDDSYQRKQRQITEALQGRIVPDRARFLELGCGAGNITLWIAEQGYEAYGIDIIPEAIEWAKERIRKSTAIADFRVGDIAQMPCFIDSYFDVVFDADCVHMIVEENRTRCFAEMLRVLRPGGIFIRGQNVRKQDFNERVEFSQGTACFEPESRSVYVEGRREYLVLSEQELIEELTSSGFEILRVIRRPAEGQKPFLSGWVDVWATAR